MTLNHWITSDPHLKVSSEFIPTETGSDWILWIKQVLFFDQQQIKHRQEV